MFIHLFFIDNNNNSSYSEGETQTGQAAETESSSTGNLGVSNRTALNAITAAINNHMKPTIISTDQKRKRQVDRPYGESLTSVDAYIKLSNKENARNGSQQKKVRKQTQKTIEGTCFSFHNKQKIYFL